MKKPFSVWLGLGLTFALLAQAEQGRTTLGERADSIASDQKALAASRPPSSAVRNGYTVQEVKTDAVNVREYVSPSGIVFAVAWSGLIHPDLTPLLGSYFSEFDKALRQTPPKPGSRNLQVKGSQIIVEKWGQMRNLQGRAYIPTLIPPGVNIDEIQ